MKQESERARAADITREAVYILVKEKDKDSKKTPALAIYMYVLLPGDVRPPRDL